MTRLTATAIAAVLSGTIGLVAIVPAAFAQQAPAAPQQPGIEQPHHGQMQMPGQFRRGMQLRNQRLGGGAERGGLLTLSCGDNAAERMEIGFVRLSHRLDLTADQTALFDDLKASALTAQTSFADTCESPREAMAAVEPGTDVTLPNPVERLSTQLENDQLRLELMAPLLPKLQAFYDSLSADQQAALQPRRHGFGVDGPGHPPQPGEPAQPPAGEDAPTT
jgi:hypothetical protein